MLIFGEVADSMSPVWAPVCNERVWHTEDYGTFRIVQVQAGFALRHQLPGEDWELIYESRDEVACEAYALDEYWCHRG